MAMKLVDLEAEGYELRVVPVQLVRELRHVREVTTVEATERYANEPRCRDRAACDLRAEPPLAAHQGGAR